MRSINSQPQETRTRKVSSITNRDYGATYKTLTTLSIISQIGIALGAILAFYLFASSHPQIGTLGRILISLPGIGFALSSFVVMVLAQVSVAVVDTAINTRITAQKIDELSAKLSKAQN